MRKLYYTLVLLFSFFTANAQEPTMLSLEGRGGANFDGVSSSFSTTDGGAIFAISVNSLQGTGNIDSLCSYNEEKCVFLKHDLNGLVEWTKCFGQGGDSGYICMFPYPDGTCVVGGMFKGVWGYIVQKLDVNNNVIWQKEFSRGNSLMLIDMIATNDGGLVMLGESHYQDTNILIHHGNWTEADMSVIKLDSLGNKLWSIVIGGSENEYPYKLLENENGNIYVIGSTLSNDFDIVTNHGNYDVVVTKLDPLGNKIWSKTYGGTGSDVARSACFMGSGGIVIAGSTKSNDGDVNGHILGRNVWILNIDSSGSIIWNNCYGGGGDEVGAKIAQAGDGSLWIGCDVYQSGGQIDTIYGTNVDAWLLHIDSVGNFLNSKVLGSTGSERINAIYPLAGNSVLVGGFYGKANGTFNTLNFYGGTTDAFIASFSPWTTSIKDKQLKPNTINISPNPANNQVYIKIVNAAEHKYRITITDLSGKLVYKKNITMDDVIDVSDWTKGVYGVIVTDGANKIGTAKLIVQ